MRYSEIITLLLGGLGTLLLFVSASSVDEGDIRGLGSVLFLFLHTFVVVIAFPFLISAIYRNENISRWFAIGISLESILNSISMLITSQATSSSNDDFGFVFYALLELIPIILLYKNKMKITGF